MKLDAFQVHACDLLETLLWASEILTNHEGRGHSFELHYEKGGFLCSFSKPSWSGDHCSSKPMDTAQEAIYLSVEEYLNGH